MRFERLVEASKVTGMDVFGCKYGGYSWVISFAPNMGWGASYKRNLETSTVYLDGNPFPTMKAAEEACKARWRAIRNPN